MLFSTREHSLKKAFLYIVKLPFAKSILYKLSEKARGHSIAYFCLHRVLEDYLATSHPHFLNKTAITEKQAYKLLSYINQRRPFISLNESLEALKGNRKMDRSFAVLLVEVPYLETMRKLIPIVEDLRIPTTFILDIESIEDGQMPWMDEIVFRLGSTDKTELALNFIDRSFSLTTIKDRMAAAEHIIEHLKERAPSTLKNRLKQLREALSEVAIHPVQERICTVTQLEKLALNPLFSFASAGRYRLPFFDISLEDAHKEIVESKNILSSMFSRSFVPVFFYPSGFLKHRQKDLMGMMLENGYSAAIGGSFGLCRPGDNMFRLVRLPLGYGLKGFLQFELQGLSDAIDEFLLVTLAEEREL